MISILIPCLSFFFLPKSFSLPWLKKNSSSTSMSSKEQSVICSKLENVEETNESEMSILDLPELALECILAMLPPPSLCNMAGVCRSLRKRCRSDHLWERHSKEKWGRLLSNKKCVMDRSACKTWGRTLSSVWPLSWIRLNIGNHRKTAIGLPADSIMSWYMSFESGEFWFPAQVYNREHGHVGFMLSCYDAELSYDRRTDTFLARYPPHGRRPIVIEEDVEWTRLRAPPTDTPPHDLYISDCLNDLCPDDHIEVQWRRNKEFPYGWWYGVVGHLESCDKSENYCICRDSDTVVLEFNQYTIGSRWRQTIVNRKNHQEEGNEADGFYGGIRKIHNTEEISMWKSLWPKEVLE